MKRSRFSEEQIIAMLKEQDSCVEVQHEPEQVSENYASHLRQAV